MPIPNELVNEVKVVLSESKIGLRKLILVICCKEVIKRTKERKWGRREACDLLKRVGCKPEESAWVIKLMFPNVKSSYLTKILAKYHYITKSNAEEIVSNALSAYGEAESIRHINEVAKKKISEIKAINEIKAIIDSYECGNSPVKTAEIIHLAFPNDKLCRIKKMILQVWRDHCVDDPRNEKKLVYFLACYKDVYKDKEVGQVIKQVRNLFKKHM